MDVRFVGPDELRIVTRSYEEDQTVTTITARIDRRTLQATGSVTDCPDYPG